MDLAYKTKATGIDTYLNQIGKYRLLTPEEEITLGKRVQRMLQLKEKEGELTPEEKREVRLGEQAQEKFVRANLRLVVTIAKKYIRITKSLDLMDLVQEGNIGLVRGVQKFDPSRGYKFSTYAFWWIRQAMTRALGTKDRMLKLPSKVADMATHWSRRVSDLSQQLGRIPTDSELAEEFGCSQDEVALFRERGMVRMVSLDAVYNDDSDGTLHEVLVDTSSLNAETAVDQIFYSGYKEMLKDAIELLPDRERDMLKRRWGFVGETPQCYSEIGRAYGISRERVRQVVQTAERKLKYQLR